MVSRRVTAQRTPRISSGAAIDFGPAKEDTMTTALSCGDSHSRMKRTRV